MEARHRTNTHALAFFFLQAALVSALCFTSGGAIPLLAAIFVADPTIRLYCIAAATTIGL